MGNTISIFIADMSSEYQMLLKDSLGTQPDISVVGTACSGEDAYRFLHKWTPDFLVTDLLLPEMDGLSLLQRLKQEERMPRTIIVSGFVTSWTTQAASELGVAYYLPKPCSPTGVLKIIREAMSTSCPAEPDLSHDVYVFLSDFGILYYLTGHRYLMEAIQKTMSNPNVLHGITKILYPDLAKQFGTTSMCVEHSIRRAVASAWKRMAEDRKQTCCGGAFSGMQRPPSNARFIAAVANWLKRETAAVAKA